MCLKCDWNEPEGDLCKDFLWCGPRLQSESFPDAVIVWSSITSGLRHPHLGQQRSEEERCLTTLIVWRSHGCYLRCSPARNKSMDSPCRARIRSRFAARDSCPKSYFLPTFCLTSPTLLPVFCSRFTICKTQCRYMRMVTKKETNPVFWQ